MSNLPSPLPEWIAHGPITQPSGMVPNCVVVRKIDGYSPFVVHTAGFRNGEWSYSNGAYGRTLGEALTVFGNRMLRDAGQMKLLEEPRHAFGE